MRSQPFVLRVRKRVRLRLVQIWATAVGIVLSVVLLLARAPWWMAAAMLLPLFAWITFRRQTRFATPGEICPICGRFAQAHTDEELIAHVIEARRRRG